MDHNTQKEWMILRLSYGILIPGEIFASEVCGNGHTTSSVYAFAFF